MLSKFVFFNDTATTEIYTLSLHDALPILRTSGRIVNSDFIAQALVPPYSEQVHSGAWCLIGLLRDRKSTRLNSSHANISYAVFCLKKKIDDHPSHTAYAFIYAVPEQELRP